MTVYALRTLRNYAVTNTTLQIVFKSVAVAKLVYAATAWYGFHTAADRDHFEAVIGRGIRSGLCSIDQLSVRELIDDADVSVHAASLSIMRTTYNCISCFLRDVTLAMTCDLDIMIVYSHTNLILPL